MLARRSIIWNLLLVLHCLYGVGSGGSLKRILLVSFLGSVGDIYTGVIGIGRCEWVITLYMLHEVQFANADLSSCVLYIDLAVGRTRLFSRARGNLLII